LCFSKLDHFCFPYCTMLSHPHIFFSCCGFTATVHRMWWMSFKVQWVFWQDPSCQTH
jgi:hypothetical protein